MATADDRLVEELGRLTGDRVGEVAHARSIDELVELAALDGPDVVLVDEAFARSGQWDGDRLREVSDATLIVRVDPDPELRGPLPSGAAAYVTVPPFEDLLHILAIARQVARQVRASTEFGDGRGGTVSMLSDASTP